LNSYEKLLLENKAWAAERVQDDPEYFERLSKIQEPEFLWIGCSDSRVPANEITGTQPGEIFVQRNIANLVVHTDFNLLSVLDYAVNHLRVTHIIVCGHYGCGGVKAAMTHADLGMLNKWLRHIKDVYRFHERELLNIPNEGARLARLVELNVQEQVQNLAKTSIVQRAWKRHQRPHLHGWVYGLDNGIVRPVFDMPPDAHLEAIYRYDNL
jgi:carbonic anhydrase